MVRCLIFKIIQRTLTSYGADEPNLGRLRNFIFIAMTDNEGFEFWAGEEAIVLIETIGVLRRSEGSTPSVELRGNGARKCHMQCGSLHEPNHS